MNFGSRIKELRKKRNISQRELAQKAGIDFTYLSKIENNKAEPPSEDLVRNLAKELECDPLELIYLSQRVPSEDQKTIIESPKEWQLIFRKTREKPELLESIKSLVEEGDNEIN